MEMHLKLSFLIENNHKRQSLILIQFQFELNYLKVIYIHNIKFFQIKFIVKQIL
jgi:hypothetical protein